MKLPVMLCAAALAVAGSSFAQPPSDHTSPGVSPSPDESRSTVYVPPKGEVLARQEAVRRARADMRLACAADAETLCRSETFTRHPIACLNYYRLKVSGTCRQAEVRVEVAARDGA